jgi:hypothetical protein
LSNKLKQPDEGDRGAKTIQEGLGIDSDDVVQYYFPKTWPVDRQHRASSIHEWLQTEALVW